MYLSQEESNVALFIWVNIEIDHIISEFSFSDYGLIAVQLFNSVLLVYYKTLKEHKTVPY